MLDIQKNPCTVGLTKQSYKPYYLQITDAFSRFTVFLGVKALDSYIMFTTLMHYSIWFQPKAHFHAWRIHELRTDAGSAFTSDEFIKDCESHGIKVTHAAPRHQEMNGICERAWQSIRTIAFGSLVHARIGFEFFSSST